MEGNQLKEMQEFLATRNKLTELANRAGTSPGTVYNTFKASNAEKLVGRQLKVYQTAIEMICEIKSMPAQAQEALS